MNTCPNCHEPVTPETAVCGCGELLRAEVTHVQAWETETVFGTRPARANKRHFGGVIAIAMGLTVLVAAWIGIRQNLTSGGSGNNGVPSTSSTSTAVSDTQSHDEDLTSSALSSQEGVFIFSSGTKSAPHASTASLTRAAQRTGDIPTTSDSSSAADGSVGQKTTADALETVANTSSENKPADCKPEPMLKKPEPAAAAPVVPGPTTPKTAETSRTYILGPRGGCFFVTPGGAKKYVDHSLCPQTATAAARQ